MPADAAYSLSRSVPRERWLLAVPSEQPIRSAMPATSRSSTKRSASAVRCRGDSVASASTSQASTSPVASTTAESGVEPGSSSRRSRRIRSMLSRTMTVLAYAAGLLCTRRQRSPTRASVSWVRSQASCGLPVSACANPEQ